MPPVDDVRLAHLAGARALLLAPDAAGVLAALAQAVEELAGAPAEIALGRAGSPASQPDPFAVLVRAGGGAHLRVGLATAPTDAVRALVCALADDAGVALRRLESRAALRREARLDGLTGLANHGAFHEGLERLARDRRLAGSSLALVLVDIDHLKLINDVHGHRAGDAAVRAVASVVRAAARTDDLVGRIGGDELAWLLPGVDAADALRAAERVAGAVRGTSIPGPGRLSCSCGVAQVTVPDEPSRLVDRADAALYAAKAEGRGLARADGGGGRARRARVDGFVPAHVEPDLGAPATRRDAIAVALPRWAAVLGVGGAACDLLEPDGATLRTGGYWRFGRGDWSLDDERYALADYPATARALRDGRPYACRADDPEADRAERDLLVRNGFGALLLVPLVSDGAPLGIVELLDARPRTFSVFEERAASLLGAQLAALLARLPGGW